MFFVKSIIIFVVVVVAAFFGIGMMLPNASHVERSIDIEAPVGSVFSLVEDHREFQKWSPWAQLDPNMKVEYSGPRVGMGSVMAWSGNKQVGAGTSTFIEYVPNTRATVLLDFGDMGEGTATYTLSEKNSITTIVWSFDTTHDSVIERFFGLMMDGMLGKEYEKGLAKLKQLAEALPSIKTEEISYQMGDVTLSGYLAYPRGLMDPVPGVLVVHEWWGHNDYVRKRAEQLAQLGYTALALDMYGDGKVANHPEDAGKFMKEVGAHTDLAVARFDAAAELLKSHRKTDATRIAAIGYCFGGSVVLNMARMGKELNGVISFHGGLGNLAPIEAGIQMPMLVLNGADDPLVTSEQKEIFKKEMNAADLDYEFIDYPGALHAFTNPAADEMGSKFELPLKYDQAADKDSWNRLEKFLNRVFYQ